MRRWSEESEHGNLLCTMTVKRKKVRTGEEKAFESIDLF